MRWIALCATLAAGLIVGSGCQKPPANANPPPPEAERLAALAQPKLPTVKLWLGTNEMITEVARTEKQVRTGMMFRQQIAENEGMIFVFPQPHRASFYMRNTYLPLACAYLDSDGVILEIHDMTPLDERPITAATDRVRYVLETRQGWFQRHNVGVGAVIRTEKGSLDETFFGRR